MSHGLIMDIGVFDGSDTAFYLSKGFSVIGVEANPILYNKLKAQFAPQIQAGIVTIINSVASDTCGENVTFYGHSDHEGISSMSKRPDVIAQGYSEYSIKSIDMASLVNRFGLPRYLKIDIEGNEERFLSGMIGKNVTPEFISAECYSLRPCELFYELGYRRFRVVDQQMPGGFKLSEYQNEGDAVGDISMYQHWSGPFGLDLFGDGELFMDFDALKNIWPRFHSEMHRTWYDVHAWMPR